MTLQQRLDLFGSEQSATDGGNVAMREHSEGERVCVCVFVSKCGSVQFNKTCKQRQN